MVETKTDADYRNELVALYQETIFNSKHFQVGGKAVGFWECPYTSPEHTAARRLVDMSLWEEYPVECDARGLMVRPAVVA